MKSLFCFLLSTFCFSLRAQMDFSDVPYMAIAAKPINSFSPSNIAGLKYFWNYTDLPANSTVNAWTDSVSAVVFTNYTGLTAPTNTSNGVFFTNSCLRLEAGVTMPAHTAVWISFSIVAPCSGLAPLFGNDSPEKFFYAANPSGNISWYDGSFNVIGNSTSLNNLYDILYADQQTGVSWAWTNSVLFNNAATPIGTQTFTDMGAEFGVFPGNIKIKFIGIWTNAILSGSDAANLYNWDLAH